MTTRRLWLHENTGKAVLVGPTASHRDTTNRWLPLKLIKIIASEGVRRELSQDDPFIMGTMLTFEAPDWLLKREGITKDAEV